MNWIMTLRLGLLDRHRDIKMGASASPECFKCRGRDLNPHGSPHYPLKVACLPFPPPRHKHYLDEKRLLAARIRLLGAFGRLLAALLGLPCSAPPWRFLARLRHVAENVLDVLLLLGGDRSPLLRRRPPEGARRPPIRLSPSIGTRATGRSGRTESRGTCVALPRNVAVSRPPNICPPPPPNAAERAPPLLDCMSTTMVSKTQPRICTTRTILKSIPITNLFKGSSLMKTAPAVK